MIEIMRGDITRLDVDAIVNAANEALRGGGGVDGAIHRAAGPELLEECQRYPGCPTGTAVLTRGYRLAARFVIHTAGPVWDGGLRAPNDLALSYETVFQAALANGAIRTIAFPAISTGVYRFPRQEAAEIALRIMLKHEQEFDRIIACLFAEDSETIYRTTLERLRTERSE